MNPYLVAAVIAVAPIGVLIAATDIARPRYDFRSTFTFTDLRTPDPYPRCVPDPTRGQEMDGSTMMWRDELIRLSRCWIDS